MLNPEIQVQEGQVPVILASVKSDIETVILTEYKRVMF